MTREIDRDRYRERMRVRVLTSAARETRRTNTLPSTPLLHGSLSFYGRRLSKIRLAGTITSGRAAAEGSAI